MNDTDRLDWIIVHKASVVKTEYGYSVHFKYGPITCSTGNIMDARSAIDKAIEWASKKN